MNTSVQTVYDPVEMDELGEVGGQTIIDLLNGAPDDFRSTLGDLMAWHNAHATDANRIVNTSGDLMFNPRNQLSTGNYMITMSDAETQEPDEEDVTVWVHEALFEMIQYGSGTKIHVLGRTGIGPGYDREKRQPLPDVKRVMVNAFGIWPEPDTIIPLEEANVIESMDTAK